MRDKRWIRMREDKRRMRIREDIREELEKNEDERG